MSVVKQLVRKELQTTCCSGSFKKALKIYLFAVYYRSTGMEQSAVSRMGCIVAHHLPTRTENISFSLVFSGPLVANLLFSFFCMPVPY